MNKSDSLFQEFFGEDIKNIIVKSRIFSFLQKYHKKVFPKVMIPMVEENIKGIDTWESKTPLDYIKYITYDDKNIIHINVDKFDNLNDLPNFLMALSLAWIDWEFYGFEYGICIMLHAEEENYRTILWVVTQLNHILSRSDRHCIRSYDFKISPVIKFKNDRNLTTHIVLPNYMFLENKIDIDEIQTIIY